jgi:Zn-dependent protease
VEKFSLFLLVAPMLLLSMVAHEYAHGWAALKQGDDTAKSLGRLTWNPVKHIDPFMTIILPIITFYGSGGKMAFGGAKPVPVDPRQYKHYIRGDIIVSLAGIAANIALAMLCVALLIAFGLVARAVPGISSSVGLLQVMLQYGVLINLVLASFNLMPIPPLDGSHVVKHLLPLRLAVAYQRLMRWGILIVLGVVYFLPGVVRWWMAPAYWALEVGLTVAAPYIVRVPWAFGTTP